MISKIESFTISFCLKESHICIHTWPEYNQLTLDVYLCNYLQDNSQKVKDVMAAYVSYFDGVLIKDFEINRYVYGTCTNCNHTTQLVNFDVKIYACTNCVYVYQERDGLRFKDQLRPYILDQLQVGQVGVLTIPIIPLRDFGQRK
jgi:hypothetical protein